MNFVYLVIKQEEINIMNIIIQCFIMLSMDICSIIIIDIIVLLYIDKLIVNIGIGIMLCFLVGCLNL
jgi:hypothetical protein